MNPAEDLAWLIGTSQLQAQMQLVNCQEIWVDFYRAMHFSAKRDIEIAYRLSVCP